MDKLERHLKDYREIQLIKMILMFEFLLVAMFEIRTQFY